MAGTVTIVHKEPAPTIGRIIATCTADAADGSFPATALPAFQGTLLEIITNPGSTAPTDNYDITLVDGDGVDRLGGAGANRDTTTSELAAISSAHIGFGEVVTLTLANNAVNSATVVVTLLYSIAAIGGGGGGGTSSGALDTTLTTTNTEIGIVTEAAPASDTASSGLNGRLQRIAQRLTSLIALLPTSLGQKTMANSLGVVLASDQSALTVSGAVTASGTITADTELNAAAALADAASATVSTATVGSVPLLMNATTIDRARAVVNSMDTIGTGVAAVGTLLQFDDASVGTVTENQFSTQRMSSRRAALVEGTGPTTATTAGTQVASSASSVTLLSSNALRRGFAFYNGSTQACYVLFGTTASATSFTVYMPAGASYEMFGQNLYSGRIDAIWVAANGNMQITEW